MPAAAAVKSAARVLDLLEVLADAGRPLAHAELARRCSVPKSSLTQLLRTLLARGYVELDAGTQRYQPGEALFDLTRRGRDIRTLITQARPILERLAQRAKESFSISVLRDDFAERVFSVESPRRQLYSLHVGVRAPLYANSSGKVLLAWMPAVEREAYLSRTRLVPLTDRTLVSGSALRRQLSSVRTEGVARSFGEFTPGIVGIAVPILGAPGRAIASLGTALPIERLDARLDAQLVRLLKEAAAVVAARAASQPIPTGKH